MASKEDKPAGDSDDLSFLRTEDFVCLNCPVLTQNGASRRMAMAAEAFGNKMCFLEDITLENVTPDFPACIFVLEQALSVRALQEVVNSMSDSNINTVQQSGLRTLLYGHAVLLRHLQSNMYLTCLSTSTSNDKLAFDVGLQVHSQGESCWWTIHPASKQRSEGEKVRIGDDIILVSVASERYLHIYVVENMIHRVNASFQQTLWTLLPLSAGSIRMKTPGFVFGGDVLRLFHGNMDQCFTLPQAGVSEHPYNIFFETGSVCSHARSLWRLEFLRTRWYGGFMGWNTPIRLRHITSGRYLGVLNGEVCVIHRDKANAEAITFILTPTKDIKGATDTEAEETMGLPVIKYGETLVYMQHYKSSCWLSYNSYETKKRGVGKIEEKKACIHPEGHMDDCFTIVRAQEEEARSALVIRKCMSLFSKFIRVMDSNYQNSQSLKKISLETILKCLEDLIEFFAQPNENCSHEERQAKLKALRNRQDLFHEEGMISLVLETIDKYSDTKSQSSKNIQLFDGCSQNVIDDIYDQLYALLATMIKGNRNNCAQFAQGNRLDCLISRLTSQSTAKGVLEVLHCVLIDSPEALNMIKERHIQGIISLLDRNGRDPKVLSVLCSLCANNGIAVRTNQNLICENLLPRIDLLLQTSLIDQIACLRPNIMVGVQHGESMYKKWYFEVEIDFIENDSASGPPHLRIGWATTEFRPASDGADGFSPTGLGDDVYSYGFDGRNLWFAGRSKCINFDEFSGFKKGDVVGCLLDLSIPEIWFSLNGVPMKGFFREFNLSGIFFPVISLSAKISCRFLFGDEHGRFKSGPPEGCAPIYQAMLQKQKIKIEPCFSYGDISKCVFQGPPQPFEQIAFTPCPIDTSNVQVPEFIESVRDKLAENLHEIWAMYKIEQGWKYYDIRNDVKKFHNCICQFEMLPKEEKIYDTNLAMETLKTIFCLGYQVLENKQEQKRLKLIKLPNAFLQINGYKPQPLDLNNIALSQKLEELVELLAENTHNVWAKERIKSGWTYGVCENTIQKRHPYLLPYDKVDPLIKKANRETSLDTVKTLLAYGYIIEPPALDLEEGVRKHTSVGSKDNILGNVSSRTYRAEETYAIKNGKWYYEVEIFTAGSIKIGWSNITQACTIADISEDPDSYTFDCSAARKWHLGNDVFGKKCCIGDVVGVMIDLQDKTISFSLNGEFLLDPVGSESAFENININGGFVPAFNLSNGQKIKVNFGQDVNSLRYFTNCGLQEGYEPFAVNMTKQITFWYSNEIPIFETVTQNHESLEMIRNSHDSSPCIKLISKSFGSEKTKMEYLRLGLPVTFHDEFTSRSIIREKRMNALNVYKSQVEEETEANQMFNFDPVDVSYKSTEKQDQIDTTPSTSSTSKPLSSLFSKINKPEKTKSKSPFKFMNKISREPSPVNSNNKTVSRNAKNVPSKSKVSRSSEFGINANANAIIDQAMKNEKAQNKLQTNAINQNTYYKPPQQTNTTPNIVSQQMYDENYAFSDTDSSYPALMESDDMEIQAIIDYIDEYYYGVRLFPGQDSSKVYIGWATSRFHLLTNKLDDPFDSSVISQCTLINTSADGSILSSMIRKDCYLVSAAELNQNFSETDVVASKKITNSLLLGCIVDLSTGLLTFTVNGKEAPQKFQVEPGTKLYPAIFVEPTTKEILQIELGRVKNTLPLSAAMFPSLGKHVISKCPPRLKLQYLNAIRWSRVPNHNLKVHTLKMNNVLGWSLLCEETAKTQAIFIPEKDRWISILELNENKKLLEFYDSLIKLYEAVCAQSNNFVAHQVCKLIDEKQLFYCIKNQYLSGILRKGFYDLLIKLHLESFVITRSMTKHEYVVPLIENLAPNLLERHEYLMRNGIFPNTEDFVSVRPAILKDTDIKNETHRPYLIPPKINLEELKNYALSSFCESVKISAAHIRDPIGGSNSFLFVPLIRLINQLMIMGIFCDNDINLIMSYLEPRKFHFKEVKLDEGLLNKHLEDEIKYELCKMMHSICDYLLRYRVECIVNFSSEFVRDVQVDQKIRYAALKESTLPSAIIAKKTKEFRCTARDQMLALVNFKAIDNQSLDLAENIKNKLQEFHSKLNTVAQIKERPEEEINKDDSANSKSAITKIFKILFLTESPEASIENSGDAFINTENDVIIHSIEGPNESNNELAVCQNEKHYNTLSILIAETVIEWAKSAFIHDQNLVREMFFLIYRQYNALGELTECLNKTYVIGENSIANVKRLIQALSTTRSLLCVQMSACEEDIMKSCLNEIMDNKVFFQHPDLMRALCVHETVMQVMVNWLNRRQHQQEVVDEVLNVSSNQNNMVASSNVGTDEQPKEENTELVVVCCKFLSYFSRASRQNQRAMFEHLSYLLDNSAMLLARPSLRGSCPLDVAVASLMDNNDLSLALRESDLEKIAAYLSRCGLQTNSELYAKGYPDIGWDPVEGERFLDFLKFCVWVNGDSVEENANLIVRLLIRRPECLGPALRGEGGGLLKAIVDGIRMSLQIAATQNSQNPVVMAAMLDAESEISIDFVNENKFDFSRIPSEEDEDYIDIGGAILSFYASLVELLGRCAPSEETIKMGKTDSIRARSILRSLVSLEDLEGVLSLRFILAIPNQEALSEHLPGVLPSHKMSVVIFLERVYGIPDQQTFFRLLETGFLPDIRCATILDSSSCNEFEMALAVNRYLCGSVLPLLTSYSYYFDASDSNETKAASETRASLMETVLNTVYRLSRCKSLTTGQLDVVCEFLISFTNQMKPNMMRNLLKKLVDDLPTFEEYTLVPLKVLTLWYERCKRYYGAAQSGGQASEEEKRLTMTLFTRIFDALAKRAYEPELFSKALPCLSAIGCALSPDYSYCVNPNEANFEETRIQNDTAEARLKAKAFEPFPLDTSGTALSPEYEEIIRTYSEHVHDYWCYNKFEQGWSYGDTYSDSVKTHPLLKPYPNLPRKEQLKYEELAREMLKSIKVLHWAIEKSDSGISNASKNLPRLVQKKVKDGVNTNGYVPKPFDLSNITLTREQDDLVLKLSLNYHQIWSKKKKYDLENIGAGLHNLLVPYELLTESEKSKYSQFSNELIKFVQSMGYRFQKMSHDDPENLNERKDNEIRFAYNLLEKLLEYVEKAASNMQSLKESSRFSRKGSFKTSGGDVKFFTKVVLPLIEKYFQSNKSYFILKSGSSKPGLGCASSKEKEMTCSLFCKLALLIRKKLSCFGSDTNIAVRCLQVLIRAVDVSSVMKNSQEIVRASLLPLFSYAAEDLGNSIEDLKGHRLSNIKGTSQKTNAHLEYINMVLLPILASMFDHLAVNNYGQDVLIGEIQLASYKILNSLWILGTMGTKLIDRQWIIHELNRHRPLIGDCLGSFAASFPVAFLESHFNVNNQHSIMYGLTESNLSEHSLEGQDVMNKVSKNLPTLHDTINEIKDLCESGKKYEESPHIIEILLPTICSYLNRWWFHGPSAKRQQANLQNVKGNKAEKGDTNKTHKKEDSLSNNKPVLLVSEHLESLFCKLALLIRKKLSCFGSDTNIAVRCLQFLIRAVDVSGLLSDVTSELTNQVLGYILMLISNNIEDKNASWMNRLANFSQSVILNSTPDLLERNFLPVSSKISETAKILYSREIALKTARYADSTDRESTEGDLQHDYEVLVRNIYAFYPLLIKYVDLHRAAWLKNPDENSEKLYFHIAEVFNIWLKSKMFAREEKTFVSSNEIDNMILIMPNKAAGAGLNEITTTVAPSEPKSNGKKKRGKAGGSNKKFTSLIVAGLKRLIQIGINFFDGKEQEMIQMAKQKFIEIKVGPSEGSKNKQLAIPKNPVTSNNDDTLELSKDQEDAVMYFIQQYFKSTEASSREGSIDNYSVNEAIDKDTYQKTQWQRMLYRKISSKRHLILNMQNLDQMAVIERIIEIAKVLYGLHMVDHPQIKSKGTWRKLISGQRKKAVMACFRMAPLYSIPHHRAINLFLKAYKQSWLEVETENDLDISSLIPDLCPKVMSSNTENESESPETANEEGKKDIPENSVAVKTEELGLPDPLRQLITSFNTAATTEQTSGNSGVPNLTEDSLYMIYADIMSNSCVIIDDDDEEEGGGGSKEEDENIDSFQESEMQKQKLLYEQNRLADRGAAEMALLYISASKGEMSEMLEKTLHLGISLLHGGNVGVQQKMLDHLIKKKDVGFFTSLAGLMANCSVLDLDTFERCIKAEQFGGVSSTDTGSGMAGKKNLHDAEFTCSLFRFLQLLCEGHNLDFQNYLRVQTGNNTIINTIVCTVDYLLRLQESIMDFYWHYSGKSTVDKAGKENFVKAITIAKQVFNSLTEFIQGPCVGNQLTLAHSRLWDAIGGFLYIFANLQDKLSKDPHQIELLRELMTLQKDMIIMLLSMLEGNVLNGPIGKQMVDTLIENQQNVEMLLKFFDIFLKMKDLTTSDAFQEFDSNGDGWISPKEFKKAMEAQKMYSSEEIDYVLRCVDTNQDGKIDFKEFTERFHNPAKDIGFNMAVLLTNLSEHMSYDPRFDKLMKKASSFLNYFEPYLGRIEIAGSSGRIERVYFEITESNIEQWNKPQIRDSKKQFLYDIVNEGDEKEKLENFVNFCEDTIFEMEHAESISSYEQEEEAVPIISETNKTSFFRSLIDNSKYYIISFIHLLSPNKIKDTINSYKHMKKNELFKLFLSFNLNVVFFIFSLLFNLITLFFRCIYLMILGSNTVRDAQRSIQPEILDLNTQMRLRKSPSTQDHSIIDDEVKVKSFGLGISSLSDVQENLDTKEIASELELYDEQTPLRVPEVPAQKSKPPEKIPISYEETEEEVLKTNENQTASSSSSKSRYKKILSILAKNYYKMKYLALALAFVINILMMSYKAITLTDESAALDATSLLDEDSETSEETNLIEVIMMDPEDNYIEQIIKVLAIFHSSIAFGIMIAYYILKVPLVLFKREKEIARKLEFEGLWIAEQPSDDDLRSHWDKLVISTRTYPGIYWDKFVKKKVKNKYAEQFELEQLCKLLGISSKADEYTSDDSKDASKQPETGFWISYFSFSVLGNFNYFFFALHLVDVAVSIKTLTTIIKSITHNGKQLVLTIMLMLIIVYMYTVIAFNFLRKFYTKEEDGEVEQNCHDLFTCFKTNVYVGIRSGGGIGDELESPQGDPKEAARIIFDITFFFFVIVILLAILQGLIIDAFGELRDQLESVKETLEASCFICGIGTEYFDKMPRGFEVHTMREHNFANYMFFLKHLLNKPDTEYTGQETYVWNLYERRVWDFFPAGDCFRKQHEGSEGSEQGAH